MKRPGPLLAGSGGNAAPHVPAVVVRRPHPIAPGGVTTSMPTPSKACASKKASATHRPHGPVQPPMAQSISASTAPTAAEDGAMDDAQQVLEESPARLF